MSVRCPRCGREDDGSSYNCPHCFAMLHPELKQPSKKEQLDRYGDHTPGPVGRALGRLGQRLRRRRDPDTDPGAPAFDPQGGPPGARAGAGAGPGAGGPSAHPYASPGAPGPAPHPQAPPRRPMGEPDPPSYLWQSILATLLCCMPPGIVAIVYSALTISALGRGNWHEAKVSSDHARFWLSIAMVGFFVVLILVLVMILSGGGRLVTVTR